MNINGKIAQLAPPAILKQIIQAPGKKLFLPTVKGIVIPLKGQMSAIRITSKSALATFGWIDL
jgi:hypothetical protein